MPDKIQFETGNSISYLYAADGSKLRTTHTTGNNTSTTDYCNNAIYENGVLAKVLMEDGYFTVNDSKPHYFIQDHQGNNRVVMDKDGKVEEVNHFYPFGGGFTNYTNIRLINIMVRSWTEPTVWIGMITEQGSMTQP
ncbi:hypothetical protein KGMB02408_02200 [Bacteroides faecalis]|uniref:Uncharacterized protein n=1 Tax=Bacteroides faecalis TaxID=2447885 RepID=A0A401LNZ4_9BACE|nr:hypothetical protein KGMB02408_02200 [Bacteroides faecalis]